MTTGTEPAPPRRSGWRRRAGGLALAAPLLLVVGLAACGDDDGTFAPPDVTIGPRSYQTLPVATTTATTAGPVVTGVPGETVAGTQDYEIQNGDALYGIATRYKVDMQDICAVNNWNDCETHPLYTGDVIKIPPGAIVPEPEEEEPEETDAPLGTTGEGEQLCPDGSVQGTYEVVLNDAPIVVARKTDFTVEELAAANADNPAWNQFFVGQEILLPCEGDTESTDG